uniref:Uncharacterized protein n=1 Tax=Rhizophagus irregularis (strain DAOM 181602 / DAOM 197198 / MUCL 43194) TaxID=747089 RepID=U9U6A7_RHIID
MFYGSDSYMNLLITRSSTGLLRSKFLKRIFGDTIVEFSLSKGGISTLPTSLNKYPYVNYKGWLAIFGNIVNIAIVSALAELVHPLSAMRKVDIRRFDAELIQRKNYETAIREHQIDATPVIQKLLLYFLTTNKVTDPHL